MLIINKNYYHREKHKKQNITSQPTKKKKTNKKQKTKTKQTNKQTNKHTHTCCKWNESHSFRLNEKTLDTNTRPTTTTLPKYDLH